jgi:hypothetical protein
MFHENHHFWFFCVTRVVHPDAYLLTAVDTHNFMRKPAERENKETTHSLFAFFVFTSSPPLLDRLHSVVLLPSEVVADVSPLNDTTFYTQKETKEILIKKLINCSLNTTFQCISRKRFIKKYYHIEFATWYDSSEPSLFRFFQSFKT